MPARLPDEDLAPVEGTPPPHVGIAPTEFGLNTAGEALGQAASVGFRADAIATRAQALEDEKATQPIAMDIAGKLGNQLANATGPYRGEPGFAQAQSAAGQDLATKLEDAAAAGMTPGRASVLHRQVQEALVHNQAQAWEVQNTTQQQVLEKARQSQDEGTALQAFQPAQSQLMALQADLADRQLANPSVDVMSLFNKGADAIIANARSSGMQGLAPEVQASVGPLFDSMAARERLVNAGKLTDHVVAFKQASLDNQTLQTAQSAVDAANADPRLFPQMMANGGQIDQILGRLPTSPEGIEAAKDFRQRATVGFFDGLAKSDPALAQQMLTSNQYDRDLPAQAKDSLLAEIANAGPSPAVHGAAEAQVQHILPLEIASLSSTGQSTIDAGTAASLEAGLGKEGWANFQEQRRIALQTFHASGGVPIDDQSIGQLANQPMPAPGDPNYAAAQAAAVARQTAISARLKDPVAYVWGNAKGGATKAGGAAGLGAGAPGGIAKSLQDSFNGWLQPSADGSATPAQKAAAAKYVSLVTQGQANAGTIAAGAPAAIFSKAQAQAMVRPLLEAPNATARAQAIRALQSAFQALPRSAALADGTALSPHGMFIKELMNAKLPADVAAVFADTDGSPAGINLLSDFVRYESTPDLGGKLPGTEEASVRQEIHSRGLAFLQTNVTGINQQLNGAREQAWYKMTRGLMAANPGVYDNNPIAAADQVMKDVTGGYRMEGAVRMPQPLAQAQYDVTRPTGSDVAFGVGWMGGAEKVSGWTAMKRGTDLARSFAISDNGAHLTPPNDPMTAGVALKERQATWAKQVASGGFFGNLGDGRVALMVHNGTDVTIVRDDKNRPFILSFEGAIHAGRTQHGWWQDPPPPPGALQTPGQRSVNHTPQPVAAAAAAGAVAAHGQQAAPDDAEPPAFLPGTAGTAGTPPAPAGAPPAGQQEFKAQPKGGPAPAPPSAPAQGAPASADAVPMAAPGGGAPSAGEAGVDASATVPVAPPAAPALAPQNQLQRLLAAVGASPAVTRMFAGAEYADPESGPGAGLAPAPGHPAAYEPFPALNVSQNQAVQILGPAVIDKESRGISGRVSPKGALGLMQLMPDTVKQYAQRLGLPVDLERARNDPAYNVAIGTAVLNHLTSHYMTGAVPAAGIALALAAYNAGQGRLDGYKDKTGYHQGWLTSIGDPRSGRMDVNEWVSRIPFKETREYVQAVLGMTTRRLAAVQGAGPVVKG